MERCSTIHGSAPCRSHISSSHGACSQISVAPLNSHCPWRIGAGRNSSMLLIQPRPEPQRAGPEILHPPPMGRRANGGASLRQASRVHQKCAWINASTPISRPHLLPRRRAADLLVPMSYSCPSIRAKSSSHSEICPNRSLACRGPLRQRAAKHFEAFPDAACLQSSVFK
jgi:hypothetical protein